MKLLTEVEFGELPNISIQDNVTFIGSCFSSVMGNRFLQYGNPTLINCFGTVYNSASILQQLKIIREEYINERDILFYNQKYHFLQGNTTYIRDTKQTLQKVIQEQINRVKRHLSQSKFVFITLGTSTAYQLIHTKQTVANCHKLPAKKFNEYNYSQQEIAQHLHQIGNLLKELCPECSAIFFTVSPVRYLKMGLPQNTLSKAKLRLAIQEVVDNNAVKLYYLPIYELVLDELRDYRFYEQDFVHLNALGQKYIWQKISTHFFDEKEKQVRSRVYQFHQLKAHKVVDETKKQEHLTSVKTYYQNLIKDYPFLNHIKHEGDV